MAAQGEGNGQRECATRRAVADAMQMIYRCECTSDVLFGGLWLNARAPACGYCQAKGLECRPVHYG